MSSVVISIVRWAFAVAFIFGARLEAEDKPAPAPAAPAESAIAEAKRDFDTIKSARELELTRKGALPRLSVPDLHSPPAASERWTPAKPSSPEKTQKNWLVDAMEKKPSTRDGRTTGKSDRDAIRESRETEPGVSRGKTDEQDESVETGRKVESSVINPFARYLGDWMSPQDYALLKPGLEKASLDAALPQNNVLPSSFGSAGLLSPGGSESAVALFPGAASVAGSPTSPRANPYLESMNLTPPSSGVVLSPAVVAPPPIPASAIQPVPLGPPQLPPAKSKVPDFVKPATDEKYFKQLKRF